MGLALLEMLVSLKAPNVYSMSQYSWVLVGESWRRFGAQIKGMIGGRGWERRGGGPPPSLALFTLFT